MKISYNWLCEYVKTDLTPRELAERLTRAGLAADSVEPNGDDFVMDFDLTSNRPDALSHFGMAREAAVLSGTTALPPSTSVVEVAAPIDELARVEIENSDLCPRYAARLIRGITVGSSPEWLKKRLEAVGQRSISNVVDVTNFVLLELGHPLHAFDYDKLAGRRIVVRTAREGERLTTLDGTDRALTPDMLVIADGERASAMAGIMGGGDSEISDATVNVLLESAYFEPSQVRRTARALGLHTEASHRFERGADPEAVILALNRCAELIRQVAGGEVAAGVIDAHPKPVERPTIPLRHARIKALTGVEVSPVEVETILKGLGFGVEAAEGSDEWRIVPPSWRTDQRIEEDLIEEVVRIKGYDAIPASLPGWGGAGSYLAGENDRRKLRQVFQGQGFFETINFSWTGASGLESVGAASDLVVANPLDKTEDRLRTSLLPKLLDTVVHNFNHGMDNLRLFEIGKVFSGTLADLAENEHLAFVVTGSPNAGDWSRPPQPETFHSLKGVVEMLFESLQLRDVRFRAPEGDLSSPYFPGQAADIVVDGMTIGRLGRAGVACAGHYKFKQPVFAAEIRLSPVLSRPQTFAAYRPLPKFPSVERDISVLFDASVTFEDVNEIVADLNISDLVAVRLKEVFTGKQIPLGKRSFTLNLCYRAENRTLTDQEVGTDHARVLTALRDRLGAEIR